MESAATTATTSATAGSARGGWAKDFGKHMLALPIGAAVECTFISVIAVFLPAPRASASTALVVDGTGVPVVAGIGVVAKHTAASGVAGIVGAVVSIGALQRRSSEAASARAGISSCAGIPITTGLGVVRVGAP